ncbi:MAG: hypothetical protein M3R69_18995 [Acidobacteriota bacterium]|nr:hypothetical protein [Acidobacteriota bacterium]
MSTKIWMRIGISLALVVSLAFMVLASSSKVSVGSNVSVGSQATAQDVITGEWTASLVDDNSRINVNFERGVGRTGRHTMGQTYDFAELGLSREQVLSGGPAKFRLVREAGRIDCEGSFQNGKGSGTFRFTGNQSFVAAMKSRGFDFETDATFRGDHDLEDSLFTATALNLTTALADDLASAGFGKLQLEDLFKAAIFKIDSAFMREMKASGFPNMGMEELVKARIFKIDAKFVSEAMQMGFGKEPFESLVKMRIFKITPAFITEVRNEGLSDLSVEEIVKLRIFKIDGEFIRKARAEGVPIEVERLVQRRIGVGHR